MKRIDAVERLRAQGVLTWAPGEQAWRGSPSLLVNALADAGFEACKHEEARTGRGRPPAGGVWQGLNTRTGSVVSAVWVQRPDAAPALVFLEVDGEVVSA